MRIHQSRDDKFHRVRRQVSRRLLCCKLLCWNRLASNPQSETIHLPTNHVSQLLYDDYRPYKLIVYTDKSSLWHT